MKMENAIIEMKNGNAILSANSAMQGFKYEDTKYNI